MDSRIEPLEMIGLRVGDAKILRTPGGRVTPDALVGCILSVHLLGVDRILVVPHTRCAMASGEDADIVARVKAETGEDLSDLCIGASTDQRARLAEDVDLLRTTRTWPGGSWSGASSTTSTPAPSPRSSEPLRSDDCVPQRPDDFLACEPGLIPDTQPEPSERKQPMSTTWTAETTGTGAYAEVNGINLYYETIGSGRPLVLLHGGLGSGEMFGPILSTLAAEHQVILVDLQGHGRTADIDRPITLPAMADDIGALIDHLEPGPARRGRLLTSAVAWPSGRRCGTRRRWASWSWPPPTCAGTPSPPEMLAQQGQVNAAAAEFMKDTPMYELYQRVAPHPENFGTLLDKIGAMMAQDFDYSEEFRGLQVPTQIVCADADMAPPSHYVEMFAMLDGGLRDGGWMGEGRPQGGHALAVLPGLTHYNLGVSPLFAAVILDFLSVRPNRCCPEARGARRGMVDSPARARRRERMSERTDLRRRWPRRPGRTRRRR